MSSATRRTASLLPSSACWANARYLAIFISSNTRSFRTLLDMASANGFFAKRTICKSVHAQHIRSFLKFGAKTSFKPARWSLYGHTANTQSDNFRRRFYGACALL